MPKFGSIYPRKCDDCGNTYKERNGFFNHKKHGTCQKYQDYCTKQAGPITIDATPVSKTSIDADITLDFGQCKIKVDEMIDYHEAWETLASSNEVLNHLEHDTKTECKDLILYTIEHVFCRPTFDAADLKTKVCVIKDKDSVHYLGAVFSNDGVKSFAWQVASKQVFLNNLLEDMKIHLSFLCADKKRPRIQRITEDYLDGEHSSFVIDKKWLHRKIWELFKNDAKRTIVKQWHHEIQKLFNVVV